MRAVRTLDSPTPTPIPTASPTPSPTPPSEVVQIGSLYVASARDGTGCADDAMLHWSAAVSWAEGLEWLGESDWRLPTEAELSDICAARASLQSYADGAYWSSTSYSDTAARGVDFSDCDPLIGLKTEYGFVRAVRDAY